MKDLLSIGTNLSQPPNRYQEEYFPNVFPDREKPETFSDLPCLEASTASKTDQAAARILFSQNTFINRSFVGINTAESFFSEIDPDLLSLDKRPRPFAHSLPLLSSFADEDFPEQVGTAKIFSFTDDQESTSSTSLPDAISNAQEPFPLDTSIAPPSENKLNSPLILKRKRKLQKPSPENTMEKPLSNNHLSSFPKKRRSPRTDAKVQDEKSNIHELRELKKATPEEIDSAKRRCLRGESSAQISREYASKGVLISINTLKSAKARAKKHELLRSGKLKSPSRVELNTAKQRCINGETSSKISKEYASKGVYIPQQTLHSAKTRAKRRMLLQSGKLKNPSIDELNAAKQRCISGETPSKIFNEYASKGLYISEFTLRSAKQAAKMDF